MSSSTAKEDRYGLSAHMAIVCGLMDVLEEHGLLKDPKKDEDDPKTPYKVHVLNSLNSAGIGGPPYTWEGVRKHLQKLRKKEGTQAGDGASAGGTTPKAAATPKTPRKRAPAKPKNGVKTPTSKGKRKATESVAEDDDASDGSQPAPIKKAKAEPGVDDAMDQFVKFEGDDYEDGAV